VRYGIGVFNYRVVRRRLETKREEVKMKMKKTA
jgi:hypothetical protein